MTIRLLLEAKAAEMAVHDGVSVAVSHLHSAASHLAAEIRRELDGLVAELRPAPAPAVPPAALAAEAPAEPAVAEPQPEVADTAGPQAAAAPAVTQ